MQEKKEDTDTRVDDSQYPSKPLATASENELGPTFNDGWEAGLMQARDVLNRHEWNGQRDEILAIIDAVHEREP